MHCGPDQRDPKAEDAREVTVLRKYKTRLPSTCLGRALLTLIHSFLYVLPLFFLRDLG